VELRIAVIDIYPLFPEDMDAEAFVFRFVKELVNDVSAFEGDLIFARIAAHDDCDVFHIWV
jgi:hypothetical protein